jgi:polyferredoxin
MKQNIRHTLQIAFAALQNGYVPGFLKGTIYRGPGKFVCVPGLNCYSCPGALGACPIGSLQAVLGSSRYRFSYYIVGILVLFGFLFGRLICGFLCPFGLVQDLLYKIRTPKCELPPKIDRPLRLLKYAVLLALVVALPLFATNAFGTGSPAFCKWLCPAGTLGGGIPLVVANEQLRSALGWLFTWKTAILAAILTASLFIYRPFCKYLCPLGAFYGLFSKLSLTRMQVDTTTCTRCGACQKQCHMQVDILHDVNSPECIRCGACVEACPHHCISYTFGLQDSTKKKEITQ